MTERDERALREALRGLEASDPVDPAAARRGAAERRRNRQTLVGVVTVLVLVVGVVGPPRLLSGGGSEATSAGHADSRAEQAPAGGAAADGGGKSQELEPADSVPEGWKTEYYRDISFQVPQTWGYAQPPDPVAWCAGNGRSGRPRPELQSSYVWLRPETVPRPRIACGPMPDSLLSEHVVALEPGANEDLSGEPLRDGDWWLVPGFVGAAALVVTTKDRDLGERIVRSARLVGGDAPCAPTSAASELGTRPEPAHDLARLGEPDAAVLCQYEASTNGTDQRPRLRAVGRLNSSAAATLATALASGRPNVSGCTTPPPDGLPQLAVQVDFVTADQVRTVFVTARGCSDGSGMIGGVDDGTALRLLTGDGCRQVLTPPLAIFAASGAVADNCLG